MTRQNLEQVPAIIDKALELGVSSYKTTLFMPAGRSIGADVHDLLLTPDDTRRFAHMLQEKKEEVAGRLFIHNEVLYPWLTGLTREDAGFPPAKITPIGCTAANSSVYITPQGKITPCPFLRQYVAGDLRRQPIGEIWHRSDTLRMFRSITRGDLKGKCGRCELLGDSCYGGCRAAALAYSGDLFAEDPLCWKEH